MALPRTRVVVAALGTVAVLGSLPGPVVGESAAQAEVRAPGCTTPASTDGHEPPCNPALAQSPWAAAHRGSYAQASSPLPGPEAGQQIEHQPIRFQPEGNGVPIVLEFSEPYPDGRRVVWGSVISVPENEGVVKIDE